MLTFSQLFSRYMKRAVRTWCVRFHTTLYIIKKFPTVHFTVNISFCVYSTFKGPTHTSIILKLLQGLTVCRPSRWEALFYGFPKYLQKGGFVTWNRNVSLGFSLVEWSLTAEEKFSFIYFQTQRLLAVALLFGSLFICLFLMCHFLTHDKYNSD